MNLVEAQNIAHAELNKWLPGVGWTFAWNNRKRAFGLCSFSKRQIQLSKVLTAHESKDQVVDTIRHEIAHALAGGEAGHGNEWKYWARRVGATPRATAKASDETKKNVLPTWVLVDTTRGKIVKNYMRRPNPVTFARAAHFYMPGRQAETMGKLKIVSYAQYKRMV